MKEEKTFTIRSYGKTELALLYNPTLSSEGARQALRRWILFNPSLRKELSRTGYRKASHLLTPMQVRTIVKYLGEP